MQYRAPSYARQRYRYIYRLLAILSILIMSTVKTEAITTKLGAAATVSPDKLAGGGATNQPGSKQTS